MRREASMSNHESEQLLEDFPVRISLPVEWGQMDAFGHVNNTVYFRYFESARIAYFEKAEILTYMETHAIGPILRDTQCRFRIPLSYPDTVTVGACISKIDGDRFEMDYKVVSSKAATVAAEGTATVVWLNYNDSSKTALPPEIRAAISRLEGRPV